MIKQRLKTYDPSHKSLCKHSDDGSCSESEEMDLFVREKVQRREIPTVDKIIEEGDTLQSLAIQYRCTIEELKRLNNIHKDNEIYARRSIKVPHRPFMQALLPGVHSGTNSPPQTIIDNYNIQLIDLTPELIESKLNSQNDDDNLNEIIFNSSIIQKPVELTEIVDVTENDLDEEVLLIPHQRNSDENVMITSTLNWSGDDCDISVKALIVWIFVMIFAVPLIYVFYIAEHQDSNSTSITHHNKS